MRVSGSISFPENPEVTGKVGGVDAHKVSGRAESPGLNVDETNLSADLQKVQELKAQLANLPDVRPEKVQSLQRAVSNGTYQVDSGKIADAVITDLGGKE